MISRRTFTLACVMQSITSCDRTPTTPNPSIRAEVPHSTLANLAAEEGALRIDATTDEVDLQDLLDSFSNNHPRLQIEYRRFSSQPLYTNFLEEVAAGQPTADILISAAMDLQFKLVNDGFAQPYVSPEQPYLAESAVWKDQAYAIAVEPIVFGFNREAIPPALVPASHDEFAALLRREPDLLQHKVAMYDPESSGTGYLLYTHDLMLSRDTTDLLDALGRTKPKLYVSYAEVTNQLSNGEIVLAYNILSSYVLQEQSQDDRIGVIHPRDYTLVMSRIAVIPRTAPHLSAAKLFLDHVLSVEGQTILTRRFMQPIRRDVPISWRSAAPSVLRPIHFGPGLLANLDEFRRRRILREWRRILDS